MEEEKFSIVRLISAEGHVFIVDKRCAMVSGTIKTMLQGQFAGILFRKNVVAWITSFMMNIA